MVTFYPQPYLLDNHIQYYEWGTKGENAFIAQLIGINPEKNRPYAELWIGAHPKSPSDVIAGDKRVPLTEFIHQHPDEVLGKQVSRRFSGRFPFLLKVISIAEPLSIQAHPTIDQAGRLHAKDPLNYPDANHKPEIAIALDLLSALVGFKNLSEIQKTLEQHPEIADLIGRENLPGMNADRLSAQAASESLQNMIVALVKRSPSMSERLKEAIHALSADLLGKPKDQLTPEEKIFLDLKDEYPGDIGLIFIFLLNLIRLEAGQSVFLQPGVPHAYLRGNIVECMSSSDNVVRVGLTYKFTDPDALLEILDYHIQPLPIQAGEPGRDEVVYRTPVEEFQVSRIRIASAIERPVENQNRPEILLVTNGQIVIKWDGNQQEFRRGQAFLIPAAMQGYRLSAISLAEVFRVTVPIG